MKYRYLVPIALLSSILLRNEKLILLLVLIFVSFMLLYKKPKQDMYVYFFGFFVGTLIEYFFISFGAWSYRSQDVLFLNFAFYLPFLWGITALCFVKFYKKINKLKN